LTAAEIAGLLIWLTVWGTNAYFTIAMALTLGLAWYVGVAAHALLSLVEQHLWRGRRWSAWVFVFAASFVDVFSSAWGIQAFLGARGAPSGEGNWIAATVYTVLALIIALAPERAGIGHVFAVWRLLRR
jgi:hypothetical protein